MELAFDSEVFGGATEWKEDNWENNYSDKIVEEPRQKIDVVERWCEGTLKTKVEHELNYISGWKGGAR